MKRRSTKSRKPANTRRHKPTGPGRGHSENASLRQAPSIHRLEAELQRRARELEEARQQQTATADVLRIISSSLGDLEPVFDAILANAVRICEASFGTLLLYEDGLFRRVALHNAPAPYIAFNEKNPLLDPDKVPALGRLVREKRVVQTADLALAESELPLHRLAGARTLLGVPMLKDDVLIGEIGIYRNEVRPFTDDQITMVQNFAAQAVIAIENARLLNELRQRTDDLSESLEQQTATSEVLHVISRSPDDLKPVFQTMLENATRICHAKFGVLQLYEDRAFRIGAIHNAPPAFAEAMARRERLMRPTPKHPFTRLVTTKKVVQIADLTDSPAYKERDYGVVMLVELASARTFVAVPMLKENEVVGVIAIYRQEVLTFADKQIALVENFAAQAVIAVENARLLNELRRRTAELTESLQQQTAASEVLSIISSSPTNLDPVFKAILENATRICEAQFANLYLFDGNCFHFASAVGSSPQLIQHQRQRGPFQPTSGGLLDRLMQSKRTVHVTDLIAEPIPNPVAKLGGGRSTVSVPMLMDDQLIGAITIYRQDVRPFTNKQTELVQNFAAQAVIAIENSRLFNELRESLEQQTATSEVLKVISSSLGDLAPVFQSMLENATRICEAQFGVLNFLENGSLRVGATHNVPAAFAEFLQRGPYQPNPGSLLDRAIRTRRVTITADNAAEAVSRAATLGGARSTVCVPMLKDDVLIGTFTIYRQEVRPFTDKQVALLQNFAAQAVIAIENARLLTELRQRTADLSESLEQQTATSEVLSVISGSAGRLEPIFQSMLDNAVRICAAKFGFMNRYDGSTWRIIAVHDAVPAYTEFLQRYGYKRPGPDTVVARITRTRQVAHIADLVASQGYIERDPVVVAAVELGGVRTILGVPMLREDELMGAIILYRQEVRPFTDKQIELLQNFAAQAVIAIENTRLLNELRQRTDDLTESLEQQTATTEVLKVISSSPGDLQTVFQAMLENATRICGANFGAMGLWEGGAFRVAAMHNPPAAFAEARRREPVVHPSPLSPPVRVTKSKQVLHIRDLSKDIAYQERDPVIVDFVELAGVRTLLVAPMLKEAEVIGVIAIYRHEVRPFTDKQIELVQNFAAQAIIAIENARLLDELRRRTEDLSKSLEELRTTQDRLIQTQKLASLGQLTAGIAHEIKNPLNFVNNFSNVSVELIEELLETLGRVTADDKTRNEIAEFTDTLRDNLDKIAQHGRRADAIVKNMLLHSREGSGEHRPVDINALVEESLNLAYHGARAENQRFNITLERSFDPAAGKAEVYPQEISRVLINLISNGFYAATKRQGEHAKEDGYEPSLTAVTKNLGDRVEIRIRDNGIGIPPEVREKMFNPFFTTKPAGEGTGLGLSISYDIIVKQHSGSIEVDTEPGEFTEFRIILPRAGA